MLQNPLEGEKRVGKSLLSQPICGSRGLVSSCQTFPPWTILVSSNVYRKVVYIGTGEIIQCVRALHSQVWRSELEFLAPIERAGCGGVPVQPSLLWVSETGGPRRLLAVILDPSSENKVVMRKGRQTGTENTWCSPLTLTCMWTCSHIHMVTHRHTAYVFVSVLYYIWCFTYGFIHLPHSVCFWAK